MNTLYQLSQATGQTPETILQGKSRKQEYVEVRQMLCYLLHQEGHTHSQISKLTGYHRVTIYHSISHIAQLLEIDDKRTLDILEKMEMQNSMVTVE